MGKSSINVVVYHCLFATKRSRKSPACDKYVKRLTIDPLRIRILRLLIKSRGDLASDLTSYWFYWPSMDFTDPICIRSGSVANYILLSLSCQRLSNVASRLLSSFIFFVLLYFIFEKKNNIKNTIFVIVCNWNYHISIWLTIHVFPKEYTVRLLIIIDGWMVTSISYIRFIWTPLNSSLVY